MANLDPQSVHAALLAEAPRVHAFHARTLTDPSAVTVWRRELAEALRACVGESPPETPLNPRWGAPLDRPFGTVRRVEFDVEPGAGALGWFVTPRRDKLPTGPGADPGTPRPTMICLQGHSSGAHISLGEARFPGDEETLAEDQDFAVQAVYRGYNAFALEQRAFGERMDGRPPAVRHHYDYDNPFTDERCRHQAMVALLLGRTLIGERVHDVSRCIDLLETLPEVDKTRIGCVGNSGGGTAAFYAACLEERIAAVMPGCSVCGYGASIGTIDHCSDNYLPGALRYFDMGDLAGLIAPRPLVIVAGDQDPIFPYEGVGESVGIMQSIYRHLEHHLGHHPGAGDAVALHTGHGGHRFYRAAWETFDQLTGWRAAAAK